MWAVERVVLIASAIFFVLYFIFTETLDWFGRIEVIRNRFPNFPQLFERRTFRVVLLLVAIGLLIRVATEHPSKKTEMQLPVAQVQTSTNPPSGPIDSAKPSDVATTQVRRAIPAIEFVSDAKEKQTVTLLSTSLLPTLIQLEPVPTGMSESDLPKFDVPVTKGTVTVLKFGRGYMQFDTRNAPAGTRIRGEVIGYTEAQGSTTTSQPMLPAHVKPRAESPKSVTPTVIANDHGTALGSITQGAGSAFSINQKGGITAGQINVGQQEWDSLLDLPKQNALIAALKQSQGKFRLEWLSQDIGGMKIAGFLNYAFLQAQWTPDQIPNYAGNMCYPNQQFDCLGLYITVKDRNSKMAKAAITGISAFVPNVHITESDKTPDDRVDVFMAKASW